MDRLDRQILNTLQEDATVPASDIARKLGLSPTPSWRRIQKLEEAGVIKSRVTILDPQKVNAGVTVFVTIKTPLHSGDWQKRFATDVASFSEVVECYRMSGSKDYILKVVVPDLATYGTFHKRLIDKIGFSNVSPAFAVDCIKETTELPLDYLILDELTTTQRMITSRARR